MATLLDLTFVMTIWLLVTADLSLVNIGIGIGIALLLTRRSQKTAGHWKTIVSLLWKIVVAIPIAYIEAFEMILRPHNHEVITTMPAFSERDRQSSEITFLEIFLITFTPKTIVLDQREDGGYDVHKVVRRRA